MLSLHGLYDNRRQQPHTTENLVYIANPASTGLWDNQGNFNEERFNQLAAQAIFDNGNQIITKALFNDFLHAIPRDGSEKEVAASVDVGPFSVDISWEQVTMGSVNELFEFLGNYTLNIDGVEQKAFTVSELRRFYEHADIYMQEIIDKRASEHPNAHKCPLAH